MNYTKGGYIGQKMSVRADLAYDNDERPMSKWTKSEILDIVIANDYSAINDLLKKYSASVLRRVLLVNSSWHHTGKHFNKTKFYSLNLDLLDSEDLSTRLEEEKANQAYDRKNKELPDVAYAAAEIRIWGGTKRHPKIIGYSKEWGVIIEDWFYIVKQEEFDFVNKRKVSGSNFTLLAKYDDYKELVKKYPELKGTADRFKKLAKKGERANTYNRSHDSN